MEQILRVSATEYAEHLRRGDCFYSPDGMEYSISYEINGKKITGGFDRKISALATAETVSNMLHVLVEVKQMNRVIRTYFRYGNLKIHFQ